MQNKTIKFMIALLAVVTNLSVMASLDESVISQASYMVYDDANDLGWMSSSGGFVTFYTAQGDYIEKVEHNFRFSSMKSKLDKSAPRPQPVAYKVKYWPAFPIKGNPRVTKGVPGDFIIFYDKNGNVIARYRFNKESRLFSITSSEGTIVEYSTDHFNDPEVMSTFPLDLSNINKK